MFVIGQTEPPMPMGEPVGRCDPVADPMLIPATVMVAMRFVQVCNESMGLRGFPGVDGVEIKEQELHPAQEQCFRSALAFLGSYFDGARVK